MFSRAQPFRYLCIDGFLTPATAANALADFPSFKAENAVNEFGLVGGKAVQTKMADISAFYREFYTCIMSQPFLDMMSAITGIPDLLPDPTLFGGGTHENRDGQELDPHVDFNRLEDLSAFRRLNLLIYLNPEWKGEWGGSIELHSDPRDPATNRVIAFEPLFNRAVIFETSEFSWHGFPKICLPQDKKHLSRKSISVYLYTKTRPAEDIAAPHATFYVQRPLRDVLVPGGILTEADVQEVKEAIARRDAWIEHYQKQELSLNQQILGGRRFLEGVLENLRAPITGYALQEGTLSGLYHDAWVGPDFSVRIQPRLPATRVTLHGWVPDSMEAGGQLTIQVGTQSTAIPLVPGPFDCQVNLLEPSTAVLPIAVHATRSCMPEGPNGRTLVFVLREIEVTHTT